jgi:hypothetical protein
VVKAAAGRYRFGARRWLKRRIRDTTDVLIGCITGPLIRPQTLLIATATGTGHVAYRGRTLPLTDQQSAEIAQMIIDTDAVAASSPWPNPLPGRWTNLTSREPLSYQPILPRIVVEIDADTANEHGRYRHPVRYLRSRAEL